MSYQTQRTVIARYFFAALGRLIGMALLWLLVTVLHELAVIAVASFLARATRWNLLEQAIALAPGAVVHGPLALRMIGDLQASKLAVRAPLGDLLSSAFPGLFSSAALLPDTAWVGVVFTPGSSAVGVHIARVAANAGLVVLGVLLCSLSGYRRLRCQGSRWSCLLPTAFWLGLFSQAYGVIAQLHLAWTGKGGGGMALSLIATKVFAFGTEHYDALVEKAGALISLGINGVVLVSAFAVALALRRVLKVAPSYQLDLGRYRRLSPTMAAAGVPGPLTLALALLLFQTPLKAGPTFALPIVVPQQMAHPSDETLVKAQIPVETPRRRGPSLVSIVEGPRGFEYRVNGERKRIRCVGYNATGGDTEEGRAKRYDRDFAFLRASRVNTILGWDQNQFDELLLEKADEHGLGVILHFELSGTWDYGDPAATEQRKGEIGAWVERHKRSPALRMWGLGNEVIHGIYRNYGKDGTPRAAAFARFLVEAADHIHHLDPHHPVIYRDAEDAFVRLIAEALALDGTPRPWFVYGMNFFTYRMEQALQKGPIADFKQPLLVSEFAVVGLRPADRPIGYLKQWSIIRSFPQRILGGCAYVWTTAGPEPLDRSFGLTDEAGNPVDGSLAALASLYRIEQGSAVDNPQDASP